MHAWNQPVLDSLKRRLDRLPHALLLHGPRGVGKLQLAERISQLLLCEAQDAARRPCGACDGCRWFLGGNHPDFRRIEPEAMAQQSENAEEGDDAPAKKGKPSIQIKVEQVRELADFLNVRSHRGRLRVAVVHPAEDMNPNTANALLKGLEEPPAGAIFVLVSHRPARLLPTIRSRCVAVPLPIPPREVALEWLAGQGVKDAERWLAYAGGAPLRAAEYAADSVALDRLLQSPAPVDDREQLERFTDALQKIALDRAFSAFGLAPKYRTGSARPQPAAARAWLAYARRLGQDRVLARHPLSGRLFSSEILSAMPKT
jgi:DNA polymerase-3 subunit delta'